MKTSTSRNWAIIIGRLLNRVELYPAGRLVVAAIPWLIAGGGMAAICVLTAAAAFRGR